MPECRLCGRVGVAGRYVFFFEDEGPRQQATVVACSRCWQRLNGAGAEGYLSRASGERWWLDRYGSPE
jgi:hypothetical protein